MTELFPNISKEVKETAEIAWRLAISQNNPASAAEFLNNITEYYSRTYSEEEIEFLRFYFNMKMEMMKE